MSHVAISSFICVRSFTHGFYQLIEDFTTQSFFSKVMNDI